MHAHLRTDLVSTLDGAVTRLIAARVPDRQSV